MPERKGRKRKPQRNRRPADQDFDSAAPPVSAERIGPEKGAPKPETANSTIPALRARYAGMLVAVLTLTIGILTLSEGLIGDYDGADAALRIGAGIALVVVALIIGVLALVPGRVAAWLRR